ncbi:MAG TPA: PH domain-containing protein [Allosphingosinicella sp.]|nr:PH domain-containing protein [Allosphingosinicella sp.]
MRLRALLAAIVLLAAAALAESIMGETVGLRRGAILAPLLLLLLYGVLIAPGRRYRALGYRIDAVELHIGRGVWTRVETIVPLARVQHIDVSQGPLERAFGICRLVLHTAGTMNSLVVLPGLARETAEAMRDEIRARIRQDEP